MGERSMKYWHIGFVLALLPALVTLGCEEGQVAPSPEPERTSESAVPVAGNTDTLEPNPTVPTDEYVSPTAIPRLLAPNPDQPILGVDMGLRGTDALAPSVRSAEAIDWTGREADMLAAREALALYPQAEARCRVRGAEGTTMDDIGDICQGLPARVSAAKDVLLEWDIRADHPVSRVLRRTWYYQTQPDNLMITVTVGGLTIVTHGATLPILAKAVAVHTAPAIARESLREAEIQGAITGDQAAFGNIIVGVAQATYSVQGAEGAPSLPKIAAELSKAGFSILDTRREAEGRFRVTVADSEGEDASLLLQISSSLVQYGSQADKEAATELANSLGFGLVQTVSEATLASASAWVLVGGHHANPVYGEHFDDLQVQDNGFITVRKTQVAGHGTATHIWGIAGWSSFDTLMTERWVVRNGLPARAVRQPWLAVQYCSDDDKQVALNLSDAFGWPLIQTCSPSDLDRYTGWVLVGGQYANPIFDQVFGSAVTAADAGYARIQMDDSYLYQDESRIVWGIAGWDASDTAASAQSVIEAGLPEHQVREAR